MQLLFFAVIVAAMIGAVTTGVIYVSQEPERASIHLDKVRLEEVTHETTTAVKNAVEKAQEEAAEIRDNIAGEREKSPAEPPIDSPIKEVRKFE